MLKMTTPRGIQVDSRRAHGQRIPRGREGCSLMSGNPPELLHQSRRKQLRGIGMHTVYLFVCLFTCIPHSWTQGHLHTPLPHPIFLILHTSFPSVPPSAPPLSPLSSNPQSNFHSAFVFLRDTEDFYAGEVKRKESAPWQKGGGTFRGTPPSKYAPVS